MCSSDLQQRHQQGQRHFDQRGSGKSEYDLRNGLTIEQITTDVFAVVEVMKNNGI